MLLELWTPQGRIGAIARGARRPRSRWSALLRQWRLLQLGWRGRGELMTLTEVEAETVPWRALRGRNRYCGHYANELILALTARADPLPGAFIHYHVLVEQLAGTGAADLQAALRIYELGLLEALGYLPQALRPDNANPQAHYRLDRDGSLALAQAGGFSGAHLLAIARHEFAAPEVRRTAKTLMRSLLEHHLHGKPLHSRELFGV